jgi:hypothetical protein
MYPSERDYLADHEHERNHEAKLERIEDRRIESKVSNMLEKEIQSITDYLPNDPFDNSDDERIKLYQLIEEVSCEFGQWHRHLNFGMYYEKTTKELFTYFTENIYKKDKP